MPPHRDVAAFERRAARYEAGWLGRLHHQVADQTAALTRSVSPAPARVLDVGCGTGYLLRLLAAQWPRRGKARTRTRVSKLLSAAGFTSLAWHDVYAIIKAVTGTT